MIRPASLSGTLQLLPFTPCPPRFWNLRPRRHPFLTTCGTPVTPTPPGEWDPDGQHYPVEQMRTMRWERERSAQIAGWLAAGLRLYKGSMPGFSLNSKPSSRPQPPTASQLQSGLPTWDLTFAVWHCSGVVSCIMDCSVPDYKSQSPGTVSSPFLGLGTEDTLKKYLQNQLKCC